jgi:hypothetical protein
MKMAKRVLPKGIEGVDVSILVLVPKYSIST